MDFHQKISIFAPKRDKILYIAYYKSRLPHSWVTAKPLSLWELGIRNYLIGNLSQVENRTDAGALWENYVITERLKRNFYQGSIAQYWFWRTLQQKEIDYLEEENGQLHAYEFKWNDKKSNVSIPESFAKTYPDASFQVITPKNADEFLL